jgi:hypothetical protein
MSAYEKCHLSQATVNAFPNKKPVTGQEPEPESIMRGSDEENVTAAVGAEKVTFKQGDWIYEPSVGTIIRSCRSSQRKQQRFIFPDVSFWWNVGVTVCLMKIMCKLGSGHFSSVCAAL